MTPPTKTLQSNTCSTCGEKFEAKGPVRFCSSACEYKSRVPTEKFLPLHETRHETPEEQREYDLCRLLDYARAAGPILKGESMGALYDRGQTGRIVPISSIQVAEGLELYTAAVADHKL